jgi:hypothetical protein
MKDNSQLQTHLQVVQSQAHTKAYKRAYTYTAQKK